MDQATQVPTPAQEILTRTRRIDLHAARLQPLLQLLEVASTPSPLEALRQALIEILMAQRETGERLKRLETILAARPMASSSAAPRG